MAKAQILTADGATVNVEGTAQEIAAVLKEMKVQPRSVAAPQKTPKASRINAKPARTTVRGLLDEMIQEDFFKKPRAIGDVQSQLANRGHHYPVTSLSGPLMKHVRNRRLRRFRDSGKYVYSQ